MADRALLIGINQYKNVPDLRGCVNDTADMRELLVGTLGFPEAGIRVLTDADAVKANIREELGRLIGEVSPGDRILVHLSGHGSYTADLDGDEPDGYDEMFCLHDMEWGNSATFILDDEVRVWIEQLPHVRECTVVLDTCHSGTGLRLVEPPRQTRQSPCRGPVAVDLVASLARAGGSRPLSPEESQRHEVLIRFAVPPPELEIRARNLGQPRAKRRLKRPAEKTRVILIAACRSDQTAADAFFPEVNRFQGAHTHALCSTLRKSPKVQPRILGSRLAGAMKKGNFAQEPQVEVV